MKIIITADTLEQAILCTRAAFLAATHEHKRGDVGGAIYGNKTTVTWQHNSKSVRVWVNDEERAIQEGANR